MADIRELALWHLRQHGMFKQQAEDFLAEFARGAGADFGWQDIEPYLSVRLALRLENAAVGWLNNPDHATYSESEPEETRQPHDGKRLAMRGDE